MLNFANAQRHRAAPDTRRQGAHIQNAVLPKPFTFDAARVRVSTSPERRTPEAAPNSQQPALGPREERRIDQVPISADLAPPAVDEEEVPVSPAEAQFQDLENDDAAGPLDVEAEPHAAIVHILAPAGQTIAFSAEAQREAEAAPLSLTPTYVARPHVADANDDPAVPPVTRSALKRQARSRGIEARRAAGNRPNALEFNIASESPGNHCVIRRTSAGAIQFERRTKDAGLSGHDCVILFTVPCSQVPLLARNLGAHRRETPNVTNPTNLAHRLTFFASWEEACRWLTMRSGVRPALELQGATSRLLNHGRDAL